MNYKQILKKIPLFSQLLRRVLFFFKPHIRNRFDVMKKEKINVVLDVGAHHGEFAQHLRFNGYKKKIVSFEPVSQSFKFLQKSAKKDSSWECQNFALGEVAKKAEINVLNCTPASSFFEPNDLMMKTYGPMMGKQNKELVEIKRLSDIHSQICNDSDSIFLKIDAQGYEKLILEGAGEFLNKIKLVYFEVSLVQVYKNEPTISEMIDYMSSKGFIPISIELEEWLQKKMQYLQVDILFRNAALCE